ncbi:hypothetical protein ACFFVB_03165 [Formosa undariae]|uniref:DUF3087 domain-containing protein n=1 Tax=Formosa undariae TaxID=1325436 RepID=A0ABV5EY18_9FLAO
MNPATLTPSQIESSETAFSGFDILNRLFFNNESLSIRNTSHLNIVIFMTICLFMIVAAFGIFAFYEAHTDILLNPLYNPVAYGGFIVLNGWLLFSAVVYLFKLSLYLKNKSSEFSTEGKEDIVINRATVSEDANLFVEKATALRNSVNTFLEKFNATIVQGVLHTKKVIITNVYASYNTGKVMLDTIELYLLNLDKELKTGLENRAFSVLHFK